MSYRVFWSPDAEQALERILKLSPEPSNFVAAARQIDQQLVTAASAFGESRYENVRVGFVRPLGVQFEVMEEIQTAIVFDVWRTDRKRR